MAVVYVWLRRSCTFIHMDIVCLIWPTLCMAVAYVWLRRSCTFITIDICVFDLADLMYGCGVCIAQTLMHIYYHRYMCV